jgi:hAT family C-terminal dimerisation region
LFAFDFNYLNSFAFEFNYLNSFVQIMSLKCFVAKKFITSNFFTEIYRRIVQPVKTRWNSLAMCIDSVVKMKATFRILIGEPGHDLHNIIPTDREFKVLEELLSPLLLIKSTSECLSADRPSLHIVLCCLMNILTMSAEDDFGTKSTACQTFIKRFEEEMEKRLPDYGRSEREFCIGNFLHPRFKGILLNAKTSPTYEPKQQEKTIDFIREMFRTQVQETEDVQEEVSQSILNTAMDESGWGRMPKVVRESTPTPRVLACDISDIDKELDHWLRSVPKAERTDLDILDYCKSKETDLPLLAKVAKKYYGIPITSASSERLFSAAGNVITSARTLLNTEKAEQLIFIHDNYWTLEPFMDTWKVMTDKEKEEERQRLAATQAREESPRPSTSSQSQTPSQTLVQSEFVTPTAVVRPKTPKARTLFTPRTPRSIRDEEEDVDSPGVISVRSETDSD